MSPNRSDSKAPDPKAADSKAPDSQSSPSQAGAVQSGASMAVAPAAQQPTDVAADQRPSAAIRVAMMPKDTNAMGTIFGGIILSYIDQAGAVEAHRHVSGNLVTVAMREVEFVEPVFVGDLVSYYAETLRIGTTSITVRVEVVAERRTRSEPGIHRVTVAEVVYVHVDENRRPAPIHPQESDSGSSPG